MLNADRLPAGVGPVTRYRTGLTRTESGYSNAETYEGR
jgi:hypothetical protein